MKQLLSSFDLLFQQQSQAIRSVKSK
jgi:hypothetical protein